MFSLLFNNYEFNSSHLRHLPYKIIIIFLSLILLNQIFDLLYHIRLRIY